MAVQGTRALEKWCRIVTEGYDNVNIINMTTSWRNGLGFCAIIHHFRPELIDFKALDPDDALDNNTLAFEVAEQHLGIPALLDPQDMVECELLDRLSILTYLSQFYQAFHGATAPNAGQKTKKPSSGLTGSPMKSQVKQTASGVVAGRRNEPCKICGQPVFILERLNVGGRLLHRTCFKCARCKTQLNVLGYYETEDGRYCCELCPDEEKTMAETIEANKKIVKEQMDSGVEQSTSSDESDAELSKIAPKENESGWKSKGAEKPDVSPNEDNADQATASEQISETIPEGSSALKEESTNDESAMNEENESESHQEVCEKPSEEVTSTATEENKEDDEKPIVKLHEPEADISHKDHASTSEDSDNLSEPQATKDDGDDVSVLSRDDGNDHVQEVGEIGFPKDARSENSCAETESVPVLDMKADTKCDSIDYPEEKNPFADDDDDDENSNEIALDEKKQLNDLKNNEAKKKKSTNPFGSDFDDSDDDNQSNLNNNNNNNTLSPQKFSAQGNPLSGPPKPPRVSLNPFGSDFEDDDDECMTRSSSRTISPTPSSGTIRSRKKRPAPKPPVKSSTPIPSPRTSVKSLHPVPAPRSTSATRPAPPPPPSSSSKSVIPPPRPPPPEDSAKLKKEQDNLKRRSQQVQEASCSGESSTSSKQNIALTPLSPDKASSEGQWKKKKGPAPPRPIPQKRQVKKLPRKAVNTELYDIEIKQQELERQGVKLEKTIREVCEKSDRERSEQGLENNDRDSLGPEVEDLIVQLFDLVNEKNELFRRQTELMYMKRDHRLEEEHADIEHQIRVLMAKSKRTEEEQAQEERLIERLMEIVAQRNEIVDCLEMDRLRELEEDESFEIHMGEFAAVKPTEDEAAQRKKKKKIKEKEKKKKKMIKDYDVDRDIDTSEYPNGISPKDSPKKKISSEKEKAKKLKKKIISSLNLSGATLHKKP